MDDLISRQAAIEAVLGVVPYDEYWKEQIEKAVNALPSVTPVRKKGHWIDHSDEGYVECSECGSCLTNCDGNTIDLHFCYSCGAKMEEDKK